MQMGISVCLGQLAVLTLAMSGCCKQGKFPSNIMGGALVTRDEFADEWRVNGDKVCQKVIEAAPACYVLEVKYSAEYVKRNSDSPYVSLLAAPVSLPLAVGGTLVEHEAKAHRAEYHSDFIPFALHVLPQRSYYVTSTFTGDEFLPRIIVTDTAGARVGEMKPARAQELSACRAGKLLQSRRATLSCGDG